MFRTLLCLFIGHQINRNRVWYDGVHFRGRCRRCRTPMARGQDGWQALDPAMDREERQPRVGHSHS